MKLGLRLETVFNLIDECKCVADVGCDHGKLACLCLLSGKAKLCVAVDINSKAIEKAKALACALNVSSKVEFVICDGLDKVHKKVDTIVIAGIGGKEIIKILSRCKDRKESSFIVSPNKNNDELEKWLSLNADIENEILVRERDKFYFIYKFKIGKPYKRQISNFKMLVNNSKKEFVVEYLKKQKLRIEKIIETKNIDENKKKELMLSLMNINKNLQSLD